MGRQSGLQKANCCREGERGRPGYVNAATTLVTKDGRHQVKKTPDSPVNTTASCRVEIHLHFLISYLVKQVKTDRTDASRFFFFVIALWGQKREVSSSLCLNFTSSIIPCFTWESLLWVGLKAWRPVDGTYIYSAHTHRRTHTVSCKTTHGFLKRALSAQFSMFYQIFQPGYWAMSEHISISELAWSLQSLPLSTSQLLQWQNSVV